METNQKILAIAAVLVAIIFITSMGDGDESSGETTEDATSKVNTTDDAQDTDNSTETTEEEYGPYSDYGDYGEDGYPRINACGYDHYGYPSYLGTEKEGKTCADYIDGDSECVSSPPYNYDGEIDFTRSDPLLRCCEADGTCYW